jgi:hypothetical protein
MRKLRQHTVERLRVLRENALARAARYEQRAVEDRVGASDHRQIAKRARKRARRFEIELKQRIEKMRKGLDEFPTGMTPPEPGWTLRAFRTLNLNGQNVARGVEITPEQLSQMSNAPALLAGGHVRWTPPSTPKPARAVVPPKPAPAPAPVLRDAKTGWERVVVECHAAIARAAAERGCTRRDAIDLIDSALLKRAFQSISETPRLARARTGWDGINPTPSGMGTTSHRRIVDDGPDILTAAVLPPVERIGAQS